MEAMVAWTFPSAATATAHPYNPVENSLLENFRVQHIDLGPVLTAKGRALRDVIIKQIEAAGGIYGVPALLIGQSFGAGSFGRLTQSKPFNDIDIFIVLNAGGMLMVDGGAAYRLEGNTPGPLVLDGALRNGSWISSDLVLRRIAGLLPMLPVVNRLKASTGVGSKGKSAFIKVGGLNVDVTPVLRARSIDCYYMPQGRGGTWWKPTNPKADQQRLSAQNQAQNGLLLPTIRFLKWWNEHQNNSRLKGIHLEVMIERALLGYQLEGLAQAIHLSLAGIFRQLAVPCPDPTYLGDNLDVNLQPFDRALSIASITDALANAEAAAYAYWKGDTACGRNEWAKVFPGI